MHRVDAESVLLHHRLQQPAGLDVDVVRRRVLGFGRVALAAVIHVAGQYVHRLVQAAPERHVELLRAARELLPEVEMIMMTAFATVDTAREAFKLGADDFVQKPFDVEELRRMREAIPVEGLVIYDPPQIQ